MTTAMLYFNLVDSFQSHWCPLCFAMSRATLKFMRTFVREGKSNNEVWEGLLRSRGLCRQHALVMLRAEASEYGDGLSTATLYDWLLDDLLRVMNQEEAAAGPSGWRALLHRDGERLPAGRRLADRLAPTGPCYACVHLEEYEAAAAWSLQRLVSPTRGEADFRAKFEAAAPLCLPHFRGVLREAQDDGALAYLVQVQRRKLHALSRELKEYLRKFNYQHAHEPKGPEQDSWRRTVRAFVGQIPDETVDHTKQDPGRDAPAARAPAARDGGKGQPAGAERPAGTASRGTESVRLNPAQRNSLSIALRLIEETFHEVMRLLPEPSYEEIMHGMADDLPPDRQLAIAEGVRQGREAIGRLCAQFALPTEIHQKSRLIAGKVMTLWETAMEARASNLRGYGSVAPGLAEALDPSLEELGSIVAQIDAIARHGAGRSGPPRDGSPRERGR
jgi:hypothetical protein